MLNLFVMWRSQEIHFLKQSKHFVEESISFDEGTKRGTEIEKALLTFSFLSFKYDERVSGNEPG